MIAQIGQALDIIRVHMNVLNLPVRIMEGFQEEAEEL